MNNNNISLKAYLAGQALIGMTTRSGCQYENDLNLISGRCVSIANKIAEKLEADTDSTLNDFGGRGNASLPMPFIYTSKITENKFSGWALHTKSKIPRNNCSKIDWNDTKAWAFFLKEEINWLSNYWCSTDEDERHRLRNLLERDYFGIYTEKEYRDLYNEIEEIANDTAKPKRIN